MGAGDGARHRNVFRSAARVLPLIWTLVVYCDAPSTAKILAARGRSVYLTSWNPESKNENAGYVDKQPPPRLKNNPRCLCFVFNHSLRGIVRVGRQRGRANEPGERRVARQRSAQRRQGIYGGAGSCRALRYGLRRQGSRTGRGDRKRSQRRKPSCRQLADQDRQMVPGRGAHQYSAPNEWLQRRAGASCRTGGLSLWQGHQPA